MERVHLYKICSTLLLGLYHFSPFITTSLLILLVMLTLSKLKSKPLLYFCCTVRHAYFMQLREEIITQAIIKLLGMKS